MKGIRSRVSKLLRQCRSPRQAEPIELVRLREITDDTQRRHAYNFLTDTISDQSVCPYLPTHDCMVGNHYLPVTFQRMLGVYDYDESLLAAAYFGPDWLTMLEISNNNRIPIRNIFVGMTKVAFLHAVAVVDSATRQGHGRWVIESMEEIMENESVCGIAGVADTNSIDFYRRLGYEVFDINEALVINLSNNPNLPPKPLSLPITGSSRWFAKPTVQGEFVGRCMNPASDAPTINWLNKN